MSTTFGRAALVALTVAAAIAAGGCGGGDANSSSKPASSQAVPATPAASEAKVAVPDAVKSKGTLTVAANATYAPMDFIGDDGTTIEGVDVDLGRALAPILGVDTKVQNASFDSILPGLAAKKFDIAISGMTDTKEREEVVDFVTYFSAGTSFFTRAQGGTTVKSLADLCGKTVAVEKGTVQADDVANQSKKCTSEGKPAVDLAVFHDQNGANLALSSGRAQVGLADSPVAAYQVKKSNGQLKIVGEPYGTAPYGIAIPKGTGLAEPIREALKIIMADGTYQKILTKWGVEDGAISKPVINGAVS